jgi:hypothetical protein
MLVYHSNSRIVPFLTDKSSDRILNKWSHPSERHIKEIRFLVKETHVSPEQVLQSLINAYVGVKREQFLKEEPEYHLKSFLSSLSREPTTVPVPLYQKGSDTVGEPRQREEQAWQSEQYGFWIGGGYRTKLQAGLD